MYNCKTGKYIPVSFHDLRTAVGMLHYHFKGFKQHHSLDFLLLMLNWPLKDLAKEITLTLSVPQDVIHVIIKFS